MSSSLTTVFVLLSFIFLQFSSTLVNSQSSKALFSPIKKDESTKMYTMRIYMKTPLQPSNLHIDLGSYIPWYDCFRHYKSSTWEPVLFNTSICNDLTPSSYGNCYEKRSPTCTNYTCGFDPENPVTGKSAANSVITDKFALPTVKNRAQLGPISQIVLSCNSRSEYSKIFRGLARGSTGLASLGRFKYSLLAAINRGSSSPSIFALCLPSTSNSTGIVLFNSAGPYSFAWPENDMSKFLIYAPLIQAPFGSDTEIQWYYKSPEYYIGLTSFRVNGKVVPLNQTLLEITDLARGGTKLSTSRPYSVLQSSIFQAFRDAFVKESAALNLTPVQPVAPFNVCYAAEKIKMTAAGPAVPAIDLVIKGAEVAWRIHGSNSMVRIKNGDVDAWCLGFLDGGIEPRTSLVIGGHQLEDTLLQFDLDRERVGFSSSLLQKLKMSSPQSYSFSSSLIHCAAILTKSRNFRNNHKPFQPHQER